MDAHASPDVDVTTDGRFVLVREEPDAVQTGMILMHDWFDALEALVPGSD
jgi:hypothetical protein